LVCSIGFGTILFFYLLNVLEYISLSQAYGIGSSRQSYKKSGTEGSQVQKSVLKSYVDMIQSG